MGLLEIDKLNVAAIYVTDLEKAIKFYTEILGFDRARDMSPGVLLYAKGADLTVYLQGSMKERETSANKFPHVTLCFNAKDGAWSAMEKLKKADVPITMTYGDKNSNFYGFQFTDPSGNVLEFAGKP